MLRGRRGWWDFATGVESLFIGKVYAQIIDLTIQFVCDSSLFRDGQMPNTTLFIGLINMI